VGVRDKRDKRDKCDKCDKLAMSNEKLVISNEQ
jgi:hypothetical protein